MEILKRRPVHASLMGLSAVLSITELSLAGAMAAIPYLTYADSVYISGTSATVSILGGMRVLTSTWSSTPTVILQTEVCQDFIDCVGWGRRAWIVMLAVLCAEVVVLLPLEVVGFRCTVRSKGPLIAVELLRVLTNMALLTSVGGTLIVENAVQQTTWCGASLLSSWGFRFTTGYQLLIANVGLSVVSSFVTILLAVVSCSLGPSIDRSVWHADANAQNITVGAERRVADGPSQPLVTASEKIPMASLNRPSKPLLHPAVTTVEAQPQKQPSSGSKRSTYDTVPLLL